MRPFLIRSVVALTLGFSSLTLGAVDANAALTAYLKLKGQNQGTIKGSGTQKGHEGEIKVIAVSHELGSPRDAATGQARGRRQHKRLWVTVPIDRAMPLLYNALVNNETITEFKLPVLGADGAKGRIGTLYEISLKNASISDINLKNGEDQAEPGTLQIGFTYERITWTWTDGGMAAQDDWRGGSP